MKNVPKTIYLQTGVEESEAPYTDFKQCSEVTWCADSINPTDIVYVLKDLCQHKGLLRELALRAQLIFPVTEGDLAQWEEGVKNEDFLKRIDKALGI